MLVWHLQEDMPLPDTVRSTVVRMTIRGFARGGMLGLSKTYSAGDRVHAVAIIHRDGRHDLYPFNAEMGQAFLKASHSASNGVHRTEHDFHTEGYPLYIPGSESLESFLQGMFEIGLIDGYVLRERHHEEPDTLRHLMRPTYIGNSKYRLYMVANHTVWSVEMWEEKYGEEPNLYDLYYEYEPGEYVRLLDVGDLMPKVRKKMRRYIVSWLRRKTREVVGE